MRCDFQKSECHFQSRSCSLYSFKATDKILKGGGGGVNGYKCSHTLHGGEEQKPLLHHLVRLCVRIYVARRTGKYDI